MAAGASAAPGDHIRLGEAEIIPSIDLGLEHRTNVFQRESRAVAGTALRLSPGLRAGFEGPNVAGRLAGQWELRKYIQAQAVSLDRLNDFRVQGGLDLFRASAIGLDLSDVASLRNNNSDSGRADDPFSTQLSNDATAILRLRLGPALVVSPSFSHRFTDFRVPQGALFGDNRRDYNTRQGVEPGLGVEWKFFPRTSLVLEGSYLSNVWDENVRPRFDQEGGALSVPLPNSRFIKANLGVQGQVTERISTKLAFGYGLGDYTDSDIDAKRLLVHADIRYDMLPTQRFTFGYKRDFDDSWFTNYLAYDQLFVNHQGKYGSRLSSTAEVLFRLEDYEGASLRDDVLLRVKFDGTVKLQDWASTTLGVWYTQRGSTDAVVRYNDVNIHWFATFTY